MDSKFTYVIPDDTASLTWHNQPYNPSFHLRLDWKSVPEFITIKNITTNIETTLPVLPCGCVSECWCGADL